MLRHLFFCLPLLAPVHDALAADISHVARPGDTPVRLSKVYHVSVAAILAHNKGLDPCRIKVGDVILVPPPPEGIVEDPAATPDQPATPRAGETAAKADADAILPDEEPIGIRYIVVPGDCPEAIAKRFGIPLDELCRANPNLDAKNLAVGRVLSIPQLAACPPRPVPVARPGEATTSAPLVTDFQ